MIRCPYCKSTHVYVVAGWSKLDGSVTRRRTCLDCNRKFNSSEVYVPDEYIATNKSLVAAYSEMIRDKELK